MLKSLLSAIALSILLVGSAFATDKLVLTDGRELVGEIVAKTDSYIQIKVVVAGVEKIETVWIGDVAKVVEDIEGSEGEGAPEKTEEAGPDKADAEPGSAMKAAAADLNSTQPQIVLLPLTGMVGVEFRHEEIEKVIKRADEIKESTGVMPIIVLEIESGGGAMPEMYEIAETLRDAKKNHRIVAWIKEAISAACATALHCDEIYFRTFGTAGAMTGFNSGTGESLKGLALNSWLSDASEWAEGGGRDGAIARAMIDEAFELSYDVNPETGEVTFHDDLSGEFILSRAGENLTFTSSTAIKSHFADGVADTESELASLLDLREWREDEKQYGRQVHEEWIELIERGREEIPKLLARLGIIEQGPGDRKVKIGQQIAILQKLIRWHDLVPNLITYEIPLPPKEALKRQIEEMRRSLRGG